MAKVKTLFVTHTYPEDVIKVLRQTYYLLGGSILATFGATWFFMNYLVSNVSRNPLIIDRFAMIGMIAFLVSAMVASFRAHKRDALWWVLLLIGSTSLFLAPIVLTYAGIGGFELVGNAALSTVVIFLSLSGFTYFTKTNFNFMRSFLLVGLIGLVVSSLLNAFVFQSPAASMAMSYLGVFLFSGLLLLDTSDILTGRQTNYVQATISMYLSVINIFLSLLRIMAPQD